ncbi:MAG: restriction endonuclease, partial [Nitrospirae bacterium]|nr:restriction endonuclease [Nitrospirota bacterium]
AKIATNPDEIETLSSREFEELVAELLAGFNWKVKLTPPTRDGGYDILGITTDQTKLETSWIVECKKYASANKIGIDKIRQLYGAKEYLGVSNAVIVTTSEFTREAQQFAKLKEDIKLVDKKWLVDWIGTYSPPPKKTQHYQGLAFHSCFISHSHKDHEFAAYLTSRLRDNGIKTWFSHDDLKPGQKIHEEVYKAINIFDKLIIVLSPHSINSEWVRTEIRRARRRELEEGKRLLFPIALGSFDDIRKWECFDADTGKDLAIELREYYIPSLTDWKNKSVFEIEFNKILSGLRQN